MGNLVGNGALDGAGIDWNLLRNGVDNANIPALLMCLRQMTGDRSWLEPPFAPKRGRGVDNNDDGGLDEATGRRVRDAAYDAISAWLMGKPMAMPRPENDELAAMLAVSMGEEVPPEYGEIIAAWMKLDPPETSCSLEGTKAIVIGGGISGIAAAVEMHRRGADFLIIDKNEDFGGTWWENRYPGCGVDTPNLTYTFSFQPNDWANYFPMREEIDAYIRDTARKHGLYEQALFRTRVERAEWVEAEKCWIVTVVTPDGAKEEHRANILFSAVGLLNTPKYPDIPGLETFKGNVVHSSRWPEELRLEGKRVAVVGNGASAMQIVPEIADRVSALTIFARSKQWAAPFPQFRKAVPNGIRYLTSVVPLYRDWFEQRLAWMFNDRLYRTLFRDPEWAHPERSINLTNDRHREFYTQYIKDELGDRQDLLPDLLPDYPPYLKRMLMDNGWFRTMTKPNVRLIPDRLARVDNGQLVAESGAEAEADILVLATGFTASALLSSYEVVGREGRVLREYWDGDNVDAYLGTLVPGFPNMFILTGPHTGSGHGGSMMRTMENQIHYALSIIEQMQEQGASSVEVREAVYDRYRNEVDEMHEKLLWTHKGSDNWYRNSRGRVTTITPWRNDKFWRMTRRADENDLDFGSRDEQASGKPSVARDAAVS